MLQDCGQPGFTLAERKRFGAILKEYVNLEVTMSTWDIKPHISDYNHFVFSHGYDDLYFIE